MEGQVVATADPDQMGRVRVWVPALDGENFNADNLPWADYASPFFGFTVSYPGGNATSTNDSHAAYGFWAIPKVGATVLVFCLNGNPANRCYFASTLRLHRNRSLPAGRNTDFNGKEGPFGDAGDGMGSLNPIQPAFDNLREQFQGDISSSQARTRGAYERQVAQSKEEKDGTEGYAKNPADTSYLDPQTYCLVTPGRHALILQDEPSFSRLRLKTAEGHQIIFDDTNERIYVSTAKGKSWIELDQDGHVHVFGSESISVRSGKDINLFADRDINLEANRSFNVKTNTGDAKISTGKSFHVKAAGSILQSACGIFDLDSERSIRITSRVNTDITGRAGVRIASSRNVDVTAGDTIKQAASNVSFNGLPTQQPEAADCAEPAEGPTIVPGHEPWVRPASSQRRGKNWKA